MLTIRREQMEVLDRSAFRHQVQQWVREFRVELPAATLCYSDAQLAELLQAGSTAARNYGFAAGFLMREYLRMILRTGAAGDGRPTDPTVRAVLEDPASSPAERMDRLAVLVPDPDAPQQNRVALAEAASGRAIPPAAPQHSEPHRPIDPHFLQVDGRRALPEPEETEG